MKQIKRQQVIRRISKYLFEHKILFATTLLLACLMTTLSVFVPTVIQKVLDTIFESEAIISKSVVLVSIIELAPSLKNALNIFLKSLPSASTGESSKSLYILLII